MGIQVLIVEDEGITAMVARSALSKLGYIITAIFAKGEQAVEFCRDHDPDIILMDINLAGDINGIRAAEMIIKSKNIPIVFVTAYEDKEIYEYAQKLNPAGFFNKPIVYENLNQHIQNIFER